MSYVIEYRNAGAEIQFSGQITGAEIHRAKQEYFAHEFPEGGRYVICDFTDGDKFDVSPEEVESIVEQDKRAIESHPELLEAVVAPRPFVFGLSRMWQSKVDVVRPHTAVVKTRPEAVAWLRAAGLTEVDADERGASSG
jgi:hypothetical protein